MYNRYGKRILDLAIACPATLLAAPILAAAWVPHRIFFNDGPFLFKQQRVGLNGKPFTILKVRTMHPDGSTTRLTRLLRKSSVDELPQLWNVLRADMSIVGVRPEVVERAEQSGIVHHVRHTVKPGITGPTQISVARFNLIHENLDLDEAYVSEVTFVKDLKIIMATPKALASGDTE